MAIKSWPRCDLETRLCRGLEIAERAVRLFSSTGYLDPEEPHNSFAPEKVVTEAAMLLYAASGADAHGEVRDRVDAIARLLVPLARSKRLLMEMVAHPSRVNKLVVAHVILSKLGSGDAEFDAAAWAQFSCAARIRRDAPVSASAEVSWVESLWKGNGPEPLNYPKVPASVLELPSDIAGGSRDQAYAFTHLLFYLTDFGYRSVPGIVDLQSTVLGEAEGLLARYLDAEDYDLSGELLMTWPLLGAQWNPAAAFGFRVLARVEDETGLLPCGNIHLARLEKLGGDEAARYALGTAYHTAFVMGFLCAISLRFGRNPPARISARGYDKAWVRELEPILEVDQGHWYPVFSECDDAEKGMLLPVLCQIAIAQKLRTQNYKSLMTS